MLDGASTLLTADAKAAGGIEGTGPVVIVDHTTDNVLMAFRFKHAGVKMQAAEEDFEAGGRKFRAGSFIIPAADRAALDADDEGARDLPGSAWRRRRRSRRTISTCRASATCTRGRTRRTKAGCARRSTPTACRTRYFGDIKLREGNLRQKYDVIIFPHVGGNAQSQVNGIPKTGTLPLPYKKTAETPNLGAQDQADDIRGGMGWEGLMELVKFVREGGTLITEGSTSTIFPEYNITSGVTVENPDNLFVRGSVMRGVVSDRRSPIAYGYDAQVPVYFSQAPVLNAGGGGFGGFGGGRGGDSVPGVGMNTQPMATAGQQRLSTWDPENPPSSRCRRLAAAATRWQAARTRRSRRPRRSAAAVAAGSAAAMPPRVARASSSRSRPIPTTCCCRACWSAASRWPAARRSSMPRVGQGHVVMFAIRPYWRWQTQGTFFLGFNAILNWNDLDAGRAGARRPATAQ